MAPRSSYIRAKQHANSFKREPEGGSTCSCPGPVSNLLPGCHAVTGDVESFPFHFISLLCRRLQQQEHQRWPLILSASSLASGTECSCYCQAGIASSSLVMCNSAVSDALAIHTDCVLAAYEIFPFLHQLALHSVHLRALCVSSKLSFKQAELIGGRNESRKHRHSHSSGQL